MPEAVLVVDLPIFLPPFFYLHSFVHEEFLPFYSRLLLAFFFFYRACQDVGAM